MVLDLDNTLIYTSFTPLRNPHFTCRIQEGSRIRKVAAMIRPGARELLENMAPHFEIVIFSSKQGLYANPLINKLDTGRHVAHRLNRRD